MPTREFNVLFLCTGNSARSIMAESAMNRRGRGKFKAFSAGSHPAETVHPMALELLKELNYETSALRSKSWNEFARSDSTPLDFVFTVCDKIAGEMCPLWPGQPITAHWGASDPAAFAGSDEAKRRFFFKIYTELENRIKIFSSLPFDSLDRFALERRVREIGTVKLPEDK
ncbi:MAG: arsenate reductase ArsC [Candidatus Binatus sp.]|jgi:arsenate reductase|uniref:arsenate reductase ArsC n=1 Tax=Candidatus Binatus sp. TaxID=2811406 RepID=UPI003C7688CD